MSGDPSVKKYKVLQPATSSYTNHVIFSMFVPFFVFKIKTKALKLMPCSSNHNSFKLILNDSF